MKKPLLRKFYQQPTLKVAKELLGKYLVREINGSFLIGKIVETEAYVGENDLASHASKGKTLRNQVMYGPPGHAYIYFIYGMYFCLNVVTEKEGFPAAVLIRALEPTDESLGSKARSLEVASGPGKLCRWMKITKEFNGWDLTKGQKLWVEDRGESDFEIEASLRIGVDYSGKWAKKPWRFCIKGNEFVSKP